MQDDPTPGTPEGDETPDDLPLPTEGAAGEERQPGVVAVSSGGEAPLPTADKSYSNAVVIPVAALADFFQNTARRSLPRYEKLISRPFFIDDVLFRKLDSRIRSALANTVPVTDIFLELRVGFADLTAETFNNLEECLELAGDVNRPGFVGGS